MKKSSLAPTALGICALVGISFFSLPAKSENVQLGTTQDELDSEQDAKLKTLILKAQRIANQSAIPDSFPLSETDIQDLKDQIEDTRSRIRTTYEGQVEGKVEDTVVLWGLNQQKIIELKEHLVCIYEQLGEDCGLKLSFDGPSDFTSMTLVYDGYSSSYSIPGYSSAEECRRGARSLEAKAILLLREFQFDAPQHQRFYTCLGVK
ncbi:hypothetical protein ACQU0X_25695 [Pseudovibrio ascidiaceicola]|uniref:hypothetical protein n=1 Tax=Pseudovibrio ascidiaceicola TaxID=285279 RepID=UPI003D35A397